MVKRVRGSKTGRPIMVLLDLLGRRWVLRIVWELRDRPRRFRELQDLIGASPTIVNSRLAELRLLGPVREARGRRLPADAARAGVGEAPPCPCTYGRRSGQRPPASRSRSGTRRSWHVFSSIGAIDPIIFFDLASQKSF
jgi:hypothetical protein